VAAISALVAAIIGLSATILPPLLREEVDLGYAVTLPYSDRCKGAWVVGAPFSTPSTEDLPGLPEDAVLASGSSVNVVVQGPPDRTIIIHGLRAEVRKTVEERTGTLFRDLSCGGQLPSRFLTINLDEPDLTAKLEDIDGANKERGFFPITTSESTPENLSVRITTRSGYVSFVLILDWSIGGTRQESVLDNYGEPFDIASPRDS